MAKSIRNALKLPIHKEASAMNETDSKNGLGMFVHMAFSIIASAAVMMFCFPQMYLSPEYSLIRFQDTEFLAFGLFTFIQNIVHGRIQLWNSYDQMPLAYFYLTGMMTYAHAIAAVFFLATQSLAEDTGRYLYFVSTIVFNLIPTIFRTAGFYLLLRLFTKRTSTVLLSTVLASSLFNPQFHLGLNCTAVYSLMPLTMYFCLRFFENHQVRDFCLGLLVITVAIAFNPLVGVGYFYQGLHFFLLSIFLCWLIKAAGNVIDNRGGSVSENFSFGGFIAKCRTANPSRKFVFLWSGTTLAAIAMIMLPLVYLLVSSYPDYELAHATSRFAKGVNMFGYFDRPHFGANPRLFFTSHLDYSHNEWFIQWVFIGWTCVFFSLCGALLSKDKRKYIFILTIFFFWLLQFPRNPGSVSSVAHWFNALTNPFNSVLRSAHMTGAFLLPTMMVPLFAMGIDRVRDFLFSSTEKPRITLVTVVVLCILFTMAGVFIPMQRMGMHIGSNLISYITLLGCAGIILISISLVRHRLGAGLFWISIACITIMLAGDFWAARKYFKQMADQMRMIPHQIDGLPDSVNPVGLDYQNPLLTPVREHYANSHVGQVKPFFLTDPNNMQGIFYRYTNLDKFFAEPTNYKPRHLSYAPIATDPNLQKYLSGESRISFVANAAVRDGPGIFESITDLGLTDRVVAIESDSKSIPGSLQEIAETARHPPVDVAQHFGVSFRFSDANRVGKAPDGAVTFALKLPQDFPRGLATGVFTSDRDKIHLTIDDIPLSPTQGWLIAPMQFDLQNIHLGMLHFTLPSSKVLSPDAPIQLRYTASTPINALSISRNEPDRINFSFASSRDGWLVIHFPYDQKWRMVINGVDQKTYRANKSFIGVPVVAGKNVVALEYRQDSYLRVLLFLSLCLSISILLMAIFFGNQSNAPKSLVIK